MAEADSLSSFPGNEPIFIDANIFLFHAFAGNDDAVAFLGRLERNEVKGVITPLVIDEVIFKALSYEVSKHLEKTTVAAIRKFIKRDNEDRETVMAKVKSYRDYMVSLTESGLRLVDVTGKDAIRAVDLSAEHGLLIRDALHLAAMESRGIRHIASNDSDFGRIADIRRWTASHAP